MLPIVLYGYRTWSLTLREEHTLRVSDNRVLRKISGPKREEVVGGWRRLHNEELHNLHVLPNILKVNKSRGMRWAGLCRTHGRGKKFTQYFGRKT